jgi:pyruvate formate lyase activating enzyme
MGEKTFCFCCGNVLIDRWGFQISRYLINNGQCKHCGAVIDGVGM